MAALAGGAARADPAAELADPAAGIKLRLPFAVYEKKTANQVENLVREQPDTTVPDGARFTSGAYGPHGLPYVLVWTKDEPVPARDQLARLASEGEGLARYGLSHWRFDAGELRGTGTLAAANGLKASVIVQLAKGGTVGVGYYYRDERDAAGFGALNASLTLAPERRLEREELPRGSLLAWRTCAAALAFGAAAGLTMWRARQPHPAAASGTPRPAPAPGSGAASRSRPEV